MVGSETPSRADDGIQRITLDLSAKWGLRFPQHVLQSPAKRRQDLPEEQVLSRLRWLFFYDIRNKQAATPYAIKCFERLAPKLQAGWVAKPLGDIDVLPTRTRSATARHNDFLSKKPTPTDEQAADLMKALLRYLHETIEDVKKGAIFAIDEETQKGHGATEARFETPPNHSPQYLRRSTRTSSHKTIRKTPSPYKDGNIRNFLKRSDDLPRVLDLHRPKARQPSSDEYNFDDNLLDDVEMHDAPVAKTSRDMSTVAGLGVNTALGQSESMESLEEQYHTPPDTPSRLSVKSPRTNTKRSVKAPTKVPFQGDDEGGIIDDATGNGKKRSLPPPLKPDMPRKMSRDLFERRSTMGANQKQPVGSLRYIGDPDFQKARLDRQDTSGTLHKSFSTESFSSVSSTTQTKPLSAWTTPNTSFLIETPATSFGSTTEPFELDHLREKPMQTRRSWQNLKAPFGLGLEMEVDMDMSGKAGFVPMGPPPSLAMNKNSLARKFGQDRFFVLDIPSIDPNDLPRQLRSDPNAREALLDWLVQSKHSFLSRTWRVFYVKSQSTKKAGPNAQSRIIDMKRYHRVYLFAESGHGIQANIQNGEKDARLLHHPPMTREDLIEWFMPANINRKQRALKFFTRLALGVSQTSPSVQFQPGQIVRSDDAFADAPVMRRINTARSHEKKTKRRPVQLKSAVMNDGCSRISRAAAKAIARSLNLDHTPSIMQGRIAGAKGVWMVDTLDETIPGPDGDFWIEITDSQLKFEASGEDELYPDPERVKFEVHSFARPLIQANLNFQLMPILADRGVPFEVFSSLLETDLTSKVAELAAAMDSGFAIRKWNHDVNSVTAADRIVYGIEMRGGLPHSLPEKINWFVEHGFEPKDCCRLKDFLYKAIADYCLRLENRMNIGVAKSTYAYMVADPLAVLEEGEVHVAFSAPFDQEMMLHDIDLLVARLPASLPSDIQKVRAVFKLELRGFRDVIVFPSKGDRSLAEKLSGGDYDGDRAWICWEPLIVSPFQNATFVSNAAPLSEYGIVTDPTQVSDFIRSEDYTTRFLRHAFDFTLQPNLLGICTSYFESLCYSKDSISHPSAIKIASLLGHLVDRAKAGIIFDEKIWHEFLRKERLPRNLPKPAYKDKERAVQHKSTNLIDRLVFETAKGIRQKVLHEFSTRFKDVGTYDHDLVALYKAEVEEARIDPGISRALQSLKADLRKLKDHWSAHCVRANDEEGEELSPTKGRGRRKSVLPFQALAEQIRDRFLAIRPCEEAVARSPVVGRWAREAFPLDKRKASTSLSSTDRIPDSSQPNHDHWTLLKASTAFFHFHATNFVWYACGVELGILKARAKGPRHVVSDIWECMKVDGKAVTRKMDKKDEAGGRGMGMDGPMEERIGQDEDDEYGDWGWVEGVEI
ncbi:MAG: hypothetical protein Q9219_004344 [cf. Caloplaca sp. 3 TL-2023]